MTDLKKLSNFTTQDVNNISNNEWDKISKSCHRQNKTPKLYLVGGQPGAGKSTTISKIEDSMQGNCVVINLDDYRALHPNAREIYEKGAKD
ncbi:zeta toxin family protein, partial [Campylobacter ureolyticus]